MAELSLPGYIRKSLTMYQHTISTCPQHNPHKCTPIQYGAKFQHVVEPDTSAPLTKYQIKHVQDIFGTLIYYELVVNPTIVTDLSAIASCQAKGTEVVLNACHQLLYYVATNPNAAAQFHASDMILALGTDVSYLSRHGGKIQAVAYMFLTKKN